MEREITITILKEDILLNNYIDSDNCPITKALHRAGYHGLKDVGGIEGCLDEEEEEYINIYSFNNESYKALLSKLLSMYNSEFGEEYCLRGSSLAPIPAEDFTHTIIF